MQNLHICKICVYANLGHVYTALDVTSHHDHRHIKREDMFKLYFILKGSHIAFVVLLRMAEMGQVHA